MCHGGGSFVVLGEKFAAFTNEAIAAVPAD